MKCPDCAEVLTQTRDGQLGCATCGWRRGSQRHAPGGAGRHDPDRHRCAYRLGARRCFMPATSTATVVLPANHTGPHPGPWFCAWHYATRSEPAAAARVLDDLERNGPPPAPENRREQLLAAHIARHDLARRPGEALTAFITRCRAAMPGGRLQVDLSMDRSTRSRLPAPSPAERKAALVEGFTDQVARLAADGMDTLEAERTAAESLVEALA